MNRWWMLVLACAIAALNLSVRASGADAGKPQSPSPHPASALSRPLLAAWGFDEPSGVLYRDGSGNGCDASPEGRRAGGLQRAEGVFGGALSFVGRHMVHASDKFAVGALPKISFSAWVMPASFAEKYMEIFRKEDGDQRVLFSFQEHGTILSLGLNIGGYVECDAKIDPAQVLDGCWHHCAATFDGRFMRVYLDGKEIGALERPGTITAGGAALGSIGSSNGSECFQGTMDDLRIYRDALTADEVAQLHQQGIVALAKQSENVAAGEPQLALPLVAHWTFNEKGGSVLQSAPGCPAMPIHASRVARIPGVYGGAVELRGGQRLEVRGGPLAQDLASLSITAWIRPGNLSGTREIFRREGPARMLLAFQRNGTSLTLGVDAGGYVECEGKLDPAQVLDGRWHHAAATFDGRLLRVYLDGKEIGSRQRPGKLSEPQAPARLAPQPEFVALIGAGATEKSQYQGRLDDLRIYAGALSPEQIGQLQRDGQASLARSAQERQNQVAAVYVSGKSFAETLAGTRKNLAERRVALDRELTEVIVARLRTAFSKECDEFTAWTGASPMDYLVAADNEFHLREIGRLVELAVEYMPLTEQQKKKLAPEEAGKWAELEAFRKRFDELKARGDAARYSPEWIEIALAVGPRIQFRPHVQEAVAPYQTPSTPQTRNLTADEAQESLRRDWLHQADNRPTAERIQREIQWTRRLAERIRAAHSDRPDFTKELASLAELEKQAAGPAAAARDLYFQVRQIKRSIAFRNPVLDFDKLLFVDMPYPQGSEWPHETRHRLGYMAVPGARLLTLDGLRPDGKLTQLMPQLPLHGSFWRPDLSWDGKRVVFCFKPHNEKAFHLYEIGVDGSGLVQLTDGQFDDLDPVYLPDGHILFSTTRGHTYVRCMPPTNAYVLARCDADGKNIYFVSYNNEPDYLPSVMNDGRVVYTRWEYTDKPLWRAQKLWTMNPDGTQVATFWGNQSVWPDLLKDARSIPGSRRVMFTGSAHHNWFAGSVGIIDPDRGLNFPDGLTKVTADVPWPECGNGPVDPVESAEYHASGHFPAYYSPYPLSERDFLVSAQRGGKFVLYLMDVDGNRELVYEGLNNVFHAIPLKPRLKTPLIADRVSWPDRKELDNPKPGVIYSGNVYQNSPAELRGKVKFLRVMHIDPKTYSYWHRRPYASTGPVVSAVQSEGVKRIFGTVPVEPDGSVAFYVPPMKAVHFQLLDENHRTLQTMRSFVGVMPGERRGCLGCHESHSRSPELGSGYVALAREPRQITPPPWDDLSVSYPRYVQPVLDKYCGKCHQGDGEGRKKLDLTFRPQSLFAEPYLTLIGRPSWGQPYQPPANPPPGFGIANVLMVEGYSTVDPAAYRTPQPMTKLSYKSRLIEICSSGKHHDVKVDPVSLQRVIVWIDAMCPYVGDEEVRAEDDPVFQGVDWLSIRPRVKTAPRIVRPGPVD